MPFLLQKLDNRRAMSKALLFMFLLGVLGCKREEPIVTFRVAKEAASSSTSVAASSHREIDWTVPTGWLEGAPTDMRVGSFLVKTAAGAADISVVVLSGDAGGDLSNINRWRGQLELPPITSADLEGQSHFITSAGRRMRVVDVDNKNKRLVAAIYTQGEKSWFFKMMGDDAVVKATKPGFFQFLDSTKIHDHE